MANVSEVEYPKLKLNFEDYDSFIASSLMMKKEKDLHPSNFQPKISHRRIDHKNPRKNYSRF